jgi:hypothetical protein
MQSLSASGRAGGAAGGARLGGTGGGAGPRPDDLGDPGGGTSPPGQPSDAPWPAGDVLRTTSVCSEPFSPTVRGSRGPHPTGRMLAGYAADASGRDSHGSGSSEAGGQGTAGGGGAGPGPGAGAGAGPGGQGGGAPPYTPSGTHAAVRMALHVGVLHYTPCQEPFPLLADPEK